MFTVYYAYNSALCRLYKVSFNSLDVIYAYSNLRSIKSEIELRTHTFLVGARWPSGTVPDLRLRGRGFESHQRLLCTNANSACHPSGVG